MCWAELAPGPEHTRSFPARPLPVSVPPRPQHSKTLTGSSNFTSSQCCLRSRSLTRVNCRVFVSLKMARGLRRPGSRVRSKATSLWRLPIRRSRGWRGLREPGTPQVGMGQGRRWESWPERTHPAASWDFRGHEGRLGHQPGPGWRLCAPDTRTQT